MDHPTSGSSHPADEYKRPFFNRSHLLVLIDVGFFVFLFAALRLAYRLYDTSVSLSDHLWSLLLYTFLLISVRLLFRVYSNVWRYANARAYVSLIISDACAGLVGMILARLFGISIGVWNSVTWIALFALMSLGARFCYQIRYHRRLIRRTDSEIHKIGVAIVGAGQIGMLLAEELLYNRRSHYTPLCFIDRDPQKIGSRICGLNVYAENEAIIDRIRSMPVQEIVIALPNIDSYDAKHLYDFYTRTGCKVKLYDFPLDDRNEPISDHRVLREFNIEDLLFRHTVNVDPGLSDGYYRDKTILVTGGGGSIGSELCRQIARLRPRRLVVFDIYENNAYDIQQELLQTWGDRLELAIEIGSVRERERLERVFDVYRPQIVFHAAAHKHVPLMEHSNCEAVKNNVFGTFNTADMAEKYGAEKFILISTDKAVNPTNIMGASKRMCEMVVQCRTDSQTVFAAVRFGNVLGSNGSVIPLFRRQIAAGGPLTLTDKRIIRYFMTIPEAAQLVIQAGAMAKAGELFVLDMGKPVKIIDLAEQMIRLSGLTPYKDIEIREIGLRPGEKLYEELLIKTEDLTMTDNEMIFIERDAPFSREEIDRRLGVLADALAAARDESESPQIKAALKQTVPTYHDPEEVNCTADQAEEMRIAQAAE
ncbi:MAG: polysaccharide biosynthesis protein [Clostridia bacterium]|nr:polysaccharide biosynthesis protein [Clostridia bacterium]